MISGYAGEKRRTMRASRLQVATDWEREGRFVHAWFHGGEPVVHELLAVGLLPL